MRNVTRIGLLIVATSMLGACQTSPLKGWTFGKSSVAKRMPAPEIVGGAVLEEGRAHLRDGNISSAVASFRLAALDPATAAAASNGLGVAYAKLGRPDVADRYFRAAIAMDPTNMRFTANLLRMQRSVMLARRVEAGAALAAAETARTREAALAPEDRVHRVSHGEFRITTGDGPRTAPRMAIQYRKPASAPLPADVPVEDNGQPAGDSERVALLKPATPKTVDISFNR